MYITIIDKYGAQYTRSTESSLRSYASYIANVATIYNYTRTHYPDTLLIVNSDHGQPKYMGSSFLNGIHGGKDDGNEAYFAFMNPKNERIGRHTGEWTNSDNVASTLT